MKTIHLNLIDSLYMAFTIARKDILEALNNRNTRINIIFMLGYIVFFYWISTPRPFDKEIEVVVYDAGKTSLELNTAVLEDGSEIVFMPVSSQEELVSTMPYRELGLVLPPDFDQRLMSDNDLRLEGYILWVHRTRVNELEAKYSAQFTELLERQVKIDIGDNFIITPYDVPPSTTHYTILFVTFYITLTLIPHLMLEEKRTKTIEALLVSPANVGQVVLGKAIAGLFYALLSGIVAFALHWAYVVNWGLAVLGILCTALFGIMLSLVVGSFVQTQRQLSLFVWPIVLFLLLPAFFSQEPLLMSALKTIFAWLPTTALAKLLQFSLTNGVPTSQLILNLAIAIGSTLILFAIVIWQVRRSDR